MIEQFELFGNNELVQGKTTNTHENLEQAKTSSRKRTYNKLNYNKNKPAILLKARARYLQKKQNKAPQENKGNTMPENIISLFGPEKASTTTPPNRKEKPLSFRQIASSSYLYLLVAGFSYFLISETAAYFAKTDSSALGPVFKAILLEGAVFAFWLKKPKNRLAAFFQKLMPVTIYFYTVCILSGSAVYVATTQKTEATLSQKAIAELEAEIQKATLMRDHYFQTDRVGLVTRLNNTIKELGQKLELLRAKTVHIPDQQSIWHTFFISVAYRVLIMISNLFCLYELARRYRLTHRSA